MPSYAFVIADFACERCGGFWDDAVAIAWGLCGGPGFHAGIHYRPGDRLQWRSDYDDIPQAYKAFRGPVAMVNHGDPAMLDLWLVDARDDLDGRECDGCGQTNIAVIEVKHGAIESVAVVAIADRRAVAAIAVDAELNRSYPTVTWRHGVTEKALENVKVFLEDFDLYKVSDYSLDDVDAHTKRNHEIDRALIAGARQFSTRLVFHEVAKRTGSDPYLMERRRDRLLLND